MGAVCSGCEFSSVEVVRVVVTEGGGVVVSLVVCLVVVVVVGGEAQPANAATPTQTAAPTVKRKRDWVTNIVISFPWRDYFVVVSLDFVVSVELPIGDTVVPLLWDDELVTTPLTLVVFSLLLETPATGAGIVVCVVVVLEPLDCAKAPPVIRVTAIVAASMLLII
jgi:hypothetical protein